MRKSGKKGLSRQRNACPLGGDDETKPYVGEKNPGRMFDKNGLNVERKHS